MTSQEIFYIHIHGTQRGPYTIAHIDHLLNSGLIDRDTLFWREGLEQWEPVTRLVIQRQQPKNRWPRWGVVLGVVLVLAFLARVFGPITIDGWREANQREFTEEAAYWRARDFIRSNGLPTGAVVSFWSIKRATVELRPPNAATVTVRGQVTEGSRETRRAAWYVEMQYDPQRQEWAGTAAKGIAAE